MMTYKGVEMSGQLHYQLALPSRKEPLTPIGEETVNSIVGLDAVD
jgi:hypothetical protein